MSDSWKNFQEKELISIEHLTNLKIVVYPSEEIARQLHRHWIRLLKILLRLGEVSVVAMKEGKKGESILDFYSIQKWARLGYVWRNQWSKIDYSRYQYVATISIVQSEDSKLGCSTPLHLISTIVSSDPTHWFKSRCEFYQRVDTLFLAQRCHQTCQLQWCQQ